MELHNCKEDETSVAEPAATEELGPALSWVSSTIVGTPPSSREDAGCAYDETGARLICFGGPRATHLTYGRNGVATYGKKGVLGIKKETQNSITHFPPTCHAPICSNLYQRHFAFFLEGWRQQWLNDVHVLDVGGLVGPGYAVLSCSPTSGPLTGGTPLTLTGLNLRPSSQIIARFTDGNRREAREETPP